LSLFLSLSISCMAHSRRFWVYSVIFVSGFLSRQGAFSFVLENHVVYCTTRSSLLSSGMHVEVEKRKQFFNRGVHFLCQIDLQLYRFPLAEHDWLYKPSACGFIGRSGRRLYSSLAGSVVFLSLPETASTLSRILSKLPPIKPITSCCVQPFRSSSATR